MTRFTSVAELAELVLALPPRRIVGLAGAPGAGKSTTAEALVAHLVEGGDRAALLPMDGFHLPQARLVELGRRERMGAPDTFDVPGFIGTLRALRAAPRAGGPAPARADDNSGSAVTAPGFDRTIEEPVPAALVFEQELSTVVVEGNYLLLEEGAWGEVAGLIDATVFVELDDGIRLERLIARHERFGKSPEAARAWALGPDEANARLIAASAHRADHVIALHGARDGPR